MATLVVKTLTVLSMNLFKSSLAYPATTHYLGIQHISPAVLRVTE